MPCVQLADISLYCNAILFYGSCKRPPGLRGSDALNIDNAAAGPSSLRSIPLRAPAAAAITLTAGMALVFLCVRFVDHPLATYLFDKRFHGALFRAMPDEVSAGSLFAGFGLFVIFVWIRVSVTSLRIKAIGLSTLSAALAYGCTGWVFKPLFGRSGPMLWVWHHADSFHFFAGDGGRSYYFPSGHTAFATALMVSLAITLPELRVIAVLVSLFTAFAVVILEEHFLSDALAGIIVGVVAAQLVAWLYRRLSSGAKPIQMG